jgi:hypothetical protein
VLKALARGPNQRSESACAAAFSWLVGVDRQI